MNLHQVLCELEHSSAETIQVIQKAAAVGKWWLQLHHNNVPAHALHLVQFFGKTSNHPGDSALLQPDLVPCNFRLFTKLKSPLKGNRFQTIYEVQENTMGQLMAIWENCVRFQGAYFEGDCGIIVLCTMFLVSCIFFSKCLFFIVPGWIPPGQASYVKYISNTGDTLLMLGPFSL